MNKIVYFLSVLKQVWGLSQAAHPGKFTHFSLVSQLWYRQDSHEPSGNRWFHCEECDQEWAWTGRDWFEISQSHLPNLSPDGRDWSLVLSQRTKHLDFQQTIEYSCPAEGDQQRGELLPPLCSLAVHGSLMSSFAWSIRGYLCSNYRLFEYYVWILISGFRDSSFISKR